MRTFPANALAAYKKDIFNHSNPENDFIQLARTHNDPILHRCRRHVRPSDDPVVSGYLFDPCGRPNVYVLPRRQKETQTRIISQFLLDFNLSRLIYAVVVSRLDALSFDQRWRSDIAAWSTSCAIREPLSHISTDATRRALGCAIAQALPPSELRAYTKHSHGWIRPIINEQLQELTGMFPTDIDEAVAAYFQYRDLLESDLV